MSKWISVLQELPKEQVMVKTLDCWGDVKDDCVIHRIDGEIVWLFETNKVTHWKPKFGYFLQKAR